MLEKEIDKANYSDLIFDNRKEWLSIKEASIIFSIPLNTLYKHKRQGFPVRKMGGRLMVKRREFEEWLERWAA